MIEHLYVGWARSHFTHWEPVTLPPRECLEAALRLREHVSFDLRDGEKVLLPWRTKPVETNRGNDE